MLHLPQYLFILKKCVSNSSLSVYAAKHSLKLERLQNYEAQKVHFIFISSKIYKKKC